VPSFEQSHTVEDVEVLAETERALLCRSEELAAATGEKKTWVPRSQVDDESAIQRRGDVGYLIVSRWWAREVGLCEA
jgi:hypothetical protein